MNTMTIDIAAELDFDHAPACDPPEGCRATATWIGFLDCPCEEARYACDRHKKATDLLIATNPVVCHEPCGVEWTDDETPVRWAPLGGAA